MQTPAPHGTVDLHAENSWKNAYDAAERGTYRSPIRLIVRDQRHRAPAGSERHHQYRPSGSDWPCSYRRSRGCGIPAQFRNVLRASGAYVFDQDRVRFTVANLAIRAFREKEVSIRFYPQGKRRSLFPEINFPALKEI